MDYKIVLLFVSAFAMFVLAIFILGVSTSRRVNMVYGLHGLAIAGWAVAIAGFMLATDINTAALFTTLFYAMAYAMTLSLYVYSIKFFERKIGLLSWLWILFTIVAVYFAVIHVGVLSDIIISTSGNSVHINTKAYLLYAIILVINIVLSILMFLRAKRKFSGTKLKQASVLLNGYIVASAVSLFFNLVLPLFGMYQLIWIGPIAAFLVVGVVAFSIFKYGLFDIRLIVFRSISYLFSYTLIVMLIILIAFAGVTFLIGEEVSLATLFVFAVVSLAFTLISPGIKTWFDKYTDKVFFRDAYDPQKMLNSLNAMLVNNTGIEDVVKGASAIITDSIKPTYVEFAISDKEYISQSAKEIRGIKITNTEVNELIKHSHKSSNKIISVADGALDSGIQEIFRKHKMSLVSPLKTNKGLVGLLIIGERKSGTSYSNRDKQVLETAAGSIAIAVQNNLRFIEIEEFSKTLENRVKKATAELTRTNEKLLKLDEAKDDFISMASHQLRTPLTSIKGYVSMVIEGDAGKISDQQKKFLDQAFISSQRMVYLIADLLNVSRLKTGKFIVDATEVNLPESITTEVSQLVSTAESRKLELIFNEPKEFPLVMLDDNKIRQVIMNFVDNAIYYTPSGGKITIDLKTTSKTISFIVKDNGIGVPKKAQHQLFTKFYRADNAKQARPDGTGIGLYMAKKVIVAQGGSLIFKSTEGKGSTFGFSFPRTKIEIKQTNFAKE